VLGLRLDSDMEQRLGRFAVETRRSKSEIAREAVREYLDRHAMDAELQRQLAVIAAAENGDDLDWLDAMNADLMRDEPDYDWGPSKS
jgi:RHH-type transcriptional regulator, rel operon repressor / antitoxin RelB